ncbi:hypothetical protein G6F37_013356 [Rhizopus arrhizus]|nr:hypothetical protein G6F38_013207 [Rhizopus arrhizus]KAG1138285.1 hypothetical protein G6F37_013356 [Rhizopus arrhizus]
MYQFEIILFAIFALVLLISWHFKKRMRQLFRYKKHSTYNFKLLIAFGVLIVACPCGCNITTNISHALYAFAPVYVTVMYAPANRRDRFLFLDNLALL